MSQQADDRQRALDARIEQALQLALGQLLMQLTIEQATKAQLTSELQATKAALDALTPVKA